MVNFDISEFLNDLNFIKFERHEVVMLYFNWNRYWGSSDRTGPGTRLKWDYCVPSEIPLSPYSSPTTARPPYNKGNLPINGGENQVKSTGGY